MPHHCLSRRQFIGDESEWIKVELSDSEIPREVIAQISNLDGTLRKSFKCSPAGQIQQVRRAAKCQIEFGSSFDQFHLVQHRDCIRAVAELDLGDGRFIATPERLKSWIGRSVLRMNFTACLAKFFFIGIRPTQDNVVA